MYCAVLCCVLCRVPAAAAVQRLGSGRQGHAVCTPCHAYSRPLCTLLRCVCCCVLAVCLLAAAAVQRLGSGRQGHALCTPCHAYSPILCGACSAAPDCCVPACCCSCATTGLWGARASKRSRETCGAQAQWCSASWTGLCAGGGCRSCAVFACVHMHGLLPLRCCNDCCTTGLPVLECSCACAWCWVSAIRNYSTRGKQQWIVQHNLLYTAEDVIVLARCS
jgi:hypothetical protein